MSKKISINVFSEIGKLRTVLLHQPNIEFTNLPGDHALLQRFLFEDTPYLPVAIKEHNELVNIFKKNDVEVLFIEDLVVETINQNDQLKSELIEQFIKESNVSNSCDNELKQYLTSLPSKQLITEMIGGIKKSELGIVCNALEEAFITDPMPNILFQRDPFSSIGNGVAISKMKKSVRQRETLFSQFVFLHHPRFQDVVRFYSRELPNSVEGGDILVLNAETLIIGLTERTDLEGAKELFLNLKNSSFKRIILIDLKTKNRAFMHLDTIFTNIDVDKFLVHPIIFSDHNQFKI
jgi:arginine deiminase